MKQEIITTADGSKTIYLPEWNETYHSKHGAVQEAKHVYIEAGLKYCHNLTNKKSLNILEIGFGTGLNAFLSAIYAKRNKIKLNYHAIEKYPLSTQLVNSVNYAQELEIDNLMFNKMHNMAWEKLIEIHNCFSLKKIEVDLHLFESQENFDVVFFDAFGPRVQPELWAKQILEKLYNMMTKNGVLVTYSCKGSVRRDLQSIGFKVVKIPGPPGKREMLRAQS